MMHRSVQKLLLQLSALIVFCLVGPLTIAAANSPQVLVLHSYHYELSWTQGIQRGIEQAFREKAINVTLQTEFMDARRNESTLHLARLADLYAEKFRSRKFDLILISDNNALEFALEQRNRLFPDVPIVFCGINDFHESLLKGAANVTGVAETLDFRSTLSLALRLHPEVSKVHVFGDNSLSYFAIRKELIQVVPEFSYRVAFSLHDGDYLDEVLEHVKHFDKSDLILAVSALKTRQGDFVSFEQTMKILSAASAAPIYGMWDFFLGHGMVGGKVTESVLQGQKAGELAVRVLQGESASSIPILRQSPTHFMFDHRQLQRFGIDSAILPSDSLVINSPRTAYTVDRSLVIAASLLFAAGGMLVIGLLIVSKRWQRMSRGLAQENVYLNTLHEISLGLFNRLQLEGLLEMIVQRAAELMKTSHGFI